MSSPPAATWLLAVFLGSAPAGFALALPAVAQTAEPVAPPGNSAGGDGAESTPPPPVEIVKAQIKGAPGNRHVRGIRPLRRGGGRVDWSQQGDWIAFDEADERGVYEIRLMNIQTGAERCLTCDVYDLRKIHSLSPVWHPSGDYLVFQVQDLPRRMRLDAVKLATPHRGLHGDLWAISRDGRDAWQLTKISDNGGAVVDPHFSYEADRLVWSERVESVRGRWGLWAVQVADFKIKRGLPRLGKVKTYLDGLPQGFVLAAGFTANDRGLLMSASDVGRDILRLDLETGETERLVATREYRDDLPALAPRGDRIVWVSDRGIEPTGEERLPYRGDLWFMSQLERLQERLTFFNDPDWEHARGETLIDDIACSPEGDRLLIHLVSFAPDEIAVEDETPVDEAIYLVELDDSFLR